MHPTKEVSIWCSSACALMHMSSIVPPHCVFTCGRGFFQHSDGTCAKCPVGTSCPDVHTRVEDITLDTNYWRVSPTSLSVKPCPTNKDWCKGGKQAGNPQCNKKQQICNKDIACKTTKSVLLANKSDIRSHIRANCTASRLEYHV